MANAEDKKPEEGTFQNGAGETAQISAIEGATVAPIEADAVQAQANVHGLGPDTTTDHGWNPDYEGLPFRKPELEPAPLTAESSAENIDYFARWTTWGELTGRADLSMEQIIEAMTKRREELVAQYTADVAALVTAAVKAAETAKASAPVVEDKGVQDKSAPPPPVAPTPVVKATVAAVAPSVEPAEPSDFQKLVSRIETNGTAGQKALLGSLQSYLENMRKNKPVVPTNGAAHNATLWQSLFTVVEKHTGEEFRGSWNLILAFFEQYKNDAYGPRHVFRFADNWTRDPAHLAGMQRLINLIHLTSDRSGWEENLKRVDLGRTLAHPFTEEGRSRVQGYYGK